ncbi:MAG: IS21-like element helper ATPase IstB [Chlamydiota bacterium]
MIEEKNTEQNNLSAGMEEVCKQLRLPTIGHQYHRIIQRYEKEVAAQKKAEEVLYALLTSEREGRQIKARLKRIKEAEFPRLKRFEELDVGSLPSGAQTHLEALKRLEFLQKNQNVILVGNAGTGKSHMSIACGIEACEKGYRVSFKTAAGLVNELKESKSQRHLVALNKKNEKIDLLILDELGYISFDKEGAELLFSYLAMRYETKSTIITTNLNFSDWNRIFQEEALTIALLDRVTQNARIINMNGSSYRRKKP